MIRDLRNHKRTIEIKYELMNEHGEDFSLDEYVNRILEDIKIVVEQRKTIPTIKTEITIY